MDTRQRFDSDDAALTALAEFRTELGAAPQAGARNRMRHTILNATQHPRPVSRVRFITVTRRAVVGSVAALAVAGAVGAAVVAPHLTDRTDRNLPAGQRPPRVEVNADTGAPLILELAAQRAATSSPVSIRAGQFVYTRTEESHSSVSDAGPGQTSVGLRSDAWTEIWYDPEGMLAVRIRGESGINVRPLTEADRAAAERDGHLEQEPEKHDEAVADYEARKAELAKSGPTLMRPTAGYLAGLPTDQDQLLAALRTAAIAALRESWPTLQSPTADDDSVFGLTVHAFRTADAIIPPTLKAALYRVLVKLSGVERVPGEVKVGGRTGIAIGIRAMNVKQGLEIILDAETFTFIGTRSNPGQPTETWTAVTASGVVNAIGDTA